MRWSIVVLVFLLSVAAGAVLFPDTAATPDRPVPGTPVILLVTEATRADHLSCQGYERNTTPELCSFAEDGVLFEEAYAQGSWTRVSLASLLTGAVPSRVAVSQHNVTWPRGPVTIAEALRSGGYDPVANMHRLRKNGFLDGFERGYTRSYMPGRPTDHYPNQFIAMDNVTAVRQPADIVTDSMFLFHFYRAAPYHPYNADRSYRHWDGVPLNRTELEQDWRARGDGGRTQLDAFGEQNFTGLYDAELRQADAKIGRFLDRLRERGIYDDALIVYTSDHGERLGEHGAAYHGGTPHQELIRVPLIIKFPEGRHAGTRVQQPVRHIDVPETVYDVVGIPEPPETAGTSLLPAIRGEDLSLTAFAAGMPESAWTLIDRPYKYILQDVRGHCLEGQRPGYRLYDLGKDPQEQQPIEGSRAVRSTLGDRLCSIFRSGLEGSGERGSTSFSEQAREQLRALGYLE